MEVEGYRRAGSCPPQPKLASKNDTDEPKSTSCPHQSPKKAKRKTKATVVLLRSTHLENDANKPNSRIPQPPAKSFDSKPVAPPRPLYSVFRLPSSSPKLHQRPNPLPRQTYGRAVSPGGSV